MLYRLNIHSLNFFKSIEKYTRYIAVIVIFTSSITGYVAQIILEKANGYFFPQFIWPITDVLSYIHHVPEENRILLDNAYSGFLLIRHLLIGTILLSVSLWLWIPKSLPKLRWKVPIGCFFFALILGAAYLCFRSDINQMKEVIKLTMLVP
jgi:hypothetical protein